MTGVDIGRLISIYKDRVASVTGVDIGRLISIYKERKREIGIVFFIFPQTAIE